MTQRRWTAQFVAAWLMLGACSALAGCGTVGLFGEYEVAESPEVETTPYPRLVDVPDAPPVGEYTEAVPDPTGGAAAQTDLAAAATVADVRAASLARVDPAANARAAAADAVAAANARAARLAAPVISDSEREAMLARAKRGR